MPSPKIDLIPSRSAVRSDAPTSLDVLVRITPPGPDGPYLRPAINLALVLDRSGSMAGGRKLEYARQAAIYAVEQLLPTDRLSVTTFDDKVETIIPNTPAAEKAGIVARLKQVEPGETTALHAGWAEGGEQAARHLIDEGLNRVLLLSDGLANVGLTDPEAIERDVKTLTARGVSTTTLGVGDDYHEDLLEAMARGGDGNYYYIESPRQLPDIFQTELQGLMATTGRKVTLALELQVGVEVADVLNDFEKDDAGRLTLPNLIIGMPIEVLVRLAVPPAPRAPELAHVRLAWDAPGAPGRQSSWETLALPSVPSARWDALPTNAEVEQCAVLLAAARLKRQATRALERGDIGSTRAVLAETMCLVSSLPETPGTQQEREDLNRILADLDAAKHGAFIKRAKHQSWARGHGRPSS